MKNRGLHEHRLKGTQNPLEKKFAEAWERQNKDNLTLKYLLSTDFHNRPEHISKRDSVVSATIIQWLGSTVGRGFLYDVLGLEDIWTV